MLRGYSRLRSLLDERGLTLAELQRRIAAEERAFNVKTLYRLANPDRPLERLDLGLVGAICRVLGVTIGDLILFAEPEATRLQKLPEAKQRRLDALMDRHGEGPLEGAELEELRDLVTEAERIARSNASRLAEHRRRLRRTASVSRRATVG